VSPLKWFFPFFPLPDVAHSLRSSKLGVVLHDFREQVVHLVKREALMIENWKVFVNLIEFLPPFSSLSALVFLPLLPSIEEFGFCETPFFPTG